MVVDVRRRRLLLRADAGPAQPVPVACRRPRLDGPGPNPLLQNHILVAFHPPMLYLGYVGFTVPFAFAIAALVTGRVGEGWLAETRRWTLFAWGFLTGRHRARRVVELRGARLGRVLGVGPGRERLDPAVAHRHRVHPLGDGAGAPRHAPGLEPLAARARRSRSRSSARSSPGRAWSSRCTRSSTARSGRAARRSSPSSWSVSVGLIGWRGDRLRSPGAIDSPLSREGAFLANNLLFAAFAFVVLLGTVFPLIVEASTSDRISVGAPYFDRMTMPIGLAAAVPHGDRAGAAVAQGDSRTAVGSACCGRRGPVDAAVVARSLVGAGAGSRCSPSGSAGSPAGSALRQTRAGHTAPGLRGLVGRANGGMIVHLGVLIIAVALAATQSYAPQGEFALKGGTVHASAATRSRTCRVASRTRRTDGTIARRDPHRRRRRVSSRR